MLPRVVHPAVLYHLPALGPGRFCRDASEVATRSATAGAASTEPSEATAALGVTTTAAAAPTAKATTNQVSEKKKDQPGISRFHQEEEDQQYGSAANKQHRQADLNGRLLPMVLVNRLDLGECNAGVGRDVLRDLPYTERDRRIVISLRGRRNHRAANSSDLRIIQNAFEPISHLDAATSRRHHQQHQNAAVSSLRA